MHQRIELKSCTDDTLCKKWSRAKGGLSETRPAFEQLTDCLEAELVQEWTAQERVAMQHRGDHLKIYEVASEKCMGSIDCSVGLWITDVCQYQHWRKYV